MCVGEKEAKWFGGSKIGSNGWESEKKGKVVREAKTQARICDVDERR